MKNSPWKGIDKGDAEYNFKGQGFTVRLNAMYAPKASHVIVGSRSVFQELP